VAAIINVASIGGLQAGGGVMTYRASKAAVIHFSKSVAAELAPLGVSVNCLAPGGIPTPILASSVAGLSAEAVDKFVEKTRIKMRNDRPLPRDGTPEDVAEAALYLRRSPARPVRYSPLMVGLRSAAPDGALHH